jgi:hypothetical protein
MGRGERPGAPALDLGRADNKTPAPSGSFSDMLALIANNVTPTYALAGLPCPKAQGPLPASLAVAALSRTSFALP